MTSILREAAGGAAMTMLSDDGHEFTVDSDDATDVVTRHWRSRMKSGRLVFVASVPTDIPRRTRSVYLHRLLSGAAPGELVEFADGNSANCRKSNLRPAGRDRPSIVERIDNGQSLIMLSTNGIEFKISAEDLTIALQYPWSVSKKLRVRCSAPRSSEGRASLKFYRVIMGAAGDDLVDHANGDGLDNRRSNLRKCSPSENSANKRKHRGASKFKGIRELPSGWGAQIKYRNKRTWLGTFSSEETAAAAYDAAAIAIHGEFARTNKMLGLLP